MISVKEFLNILMDRVLSIRSFGQMARQNRAVPFTSGGRRAYRIIAALVLVIGILLLTGGSLMAKVGKQASARYETASGKFARSTSAEDRTHYDDAKSLACTGQVVRVVSFFVLILGILLFLKPEILYFELKRLGFEKEEGPGRGQG